MVLQRDTKENLIWGFAKGAVSVKLQDEMSENTEESFEKNCDVDSEGIFRIYLPEHSAGGDFQLLISDEDDEIRLEHITFGDIFVCGGQSNMELTLTRTMERYGDEIKATDNKNIRFFRVPEKYNFHHTEEFIEGGSWEYARMPQLLDFGAVAYFAAKEISQREGVTVGIYNTAIGGTPIKSWVSEETMRSLGLHVAEYEECKNDEWVQNTIKSEQAQDMAWREEADKAFEQDLSGASGGTFNVPGFFAGTPLGDKCLAIHFKKEFELDEGWSDVDTKLYLGAIIDSDKVYVNGEYVGETGYLYPPRIYKIPKGLLKTGKNVVEIRFLVFRREGGFMPGLGKEYLIRRPDGKTVSLEGQWEYKVAKEMPFIENMTFFSYKATGVYNCMIYPLRHVKTRGFFFYQGESNVDDYDTYKEEFEAVIKDWRKLWGDDSLPFMFVQIASFNDGGRNGYFGRRSFLTEEQRKCCELPNTAMIQAYDLGEFNDLHPTNKKEVGRRAALAAEDLVYGKEKYIPGPMKQDIQYSEVSENECEARITFEDSIKLILSHGIGMLVEEDRNEKDVIGFCYWKGDKAYPAQAEIIDDNKVAVRYPKDAEILSYAWSDSPLDANLYSEDRLPVVPFRIELKK